MDRTQFWKLIEDARRESSGDCERQVELLQAKLAALPPRAIISFAETLEQLLHASYTWELWAAAYLMKGGCSDDGFDYFRLWLVAQGERVFGDALRDPETLADLPGEYPEDLECEELHSVADDAYEAKTGREMPEYRMPPWQGEPRGSRWEEGEEERLFPRLGARVREERTRRG